MKYLFIVFFLISFFAQAQNNLLLDSLEKELPKVTKKQKLTLYFRILNELWETNSDKSILYGQEATRLAKKINDTKQEQKALIYIANAYEMRSDYPASLDVYYQCILLAEQTENHSLLSLCYNNVGIINRKLKNLDKAIAFYQKSLVVKKILQDTLRMASTHNNLGNIYLDLHKYDMAINNFDSAIMILNNSDLNQDHRQIAVKADVLTNLGRVYMEIDDDTSIDPLTYFIKALELRILSKDKYNEAKTLMAIGDCYFGKNQYEQSMSFYHEAKTIAEKLNNKDLLTMVLKFESDYYYTKKGYKKSVEALRKYSTLKDSIYTGDKEKIISEMQTKYETQKKEKENIVLKKDNDFKQLEISKDKTIIRSMIVGIAAVMALLGIILLLLRKRSIAYKNLVTKNLELVQCDRKILESGEIIPESLQKMREGNTDDSTELSKDIELIEKLNIYFGEEKPYLYSNINIEDVSAQIDTNRTYLSKAINNVFNKSFNTLINEFRIRAARQLMTDTKYNHISLEGIGQMVGYNSRTVFYNNFKKITGLTPSYFKESITAGFSK